MIGASLTVGTRRLILVLTMAALALGVAVSEPLAAAAPKASRKKFTVVTRTFSSASTITIPDVGSATPYPAAITVAGLKQGRIRDVDLQLRGVTHNYTYDLDILLVAPDGRNAVILSDTAGDAPLANATLRLDDEGQALTPASPLPSTPFQPINVDEGPQFPDLFASAPAPSSATALSTFDGSDPNGRWSLYVVDDADGEAGAIAGGWALTIEAKVKTDRKKRRGGHRRGSGWSKERPQSERMAEPRARRQQRAPDFGPG